MSASSVQDHERIRSLAAELRSFIVTDGIPIGMCFASTRWALTRELMRHMALESRYFREQGFGEYGAAANAPMSSTKFEQRYRAHVARWTSREIDTHWREYCRDLSGLLNILDERMAFEEREIYPRIGTVIAVAA